MRDSRWIRRSGAALSPRLAWICIQSFQESDLEHDRRKGVAAYSRPAWSQKLSVLPLIQSRFLGHGRQFQAGLPLEDFLSLFRESGWA